MDRSRRTRKNDSKISLIHQLKEAKEKTEAPVYDLVTDAEYAKIVKDRLENDIVEENDLGYNDDGREIFDENDEDEYIEEKSIKSQKKKKTNPDIRPSASGKGVASSDIRNMFNNIPTNRSEKSNTKADLQSIHNDVEDLLNEEVSISIMSNAHNPFVNVQSKHIEKKSLKSKKKNKKSHHHSPKKPSKRTYETSPDLKSSKKFKIETQDEPSSMNDDSLNTKTIEDSYVGFEDPLLDECSNSEFCENPSKKEPKETKKEEKIDEIVTETKPYNNELIFSNNDDFLENNMVNTVQDYNEFLGDAKNGKLNFFWYDAYEDVKTSPGVIYLFGKVLSKDDNDNRFYKSSCLIIKELDRNLYLLPKPDSNAKNVYQEFTEIAAKYKINKFKCKPVKKLYSFELDDVPDEAEYLQVKYSASGPNFPTEKKFSHISRVFGSNTSFLENFLLDRKIKGPCWLHIEGSEICNPQISWCHEDHKILVSRPNSKILRLDKHLEQSNEKYPIPPEPPLKIASIAIKSVSLKSKESQIICVGLTIDNNYTTEKIIDPKKVSQQHYLIVSNPKDLPFPYDLKQKLPTWGPNYTPPNFESAKYSGVDIEYGGGERALLNKLLTKITFLDPDLIIGHDLWGNQLDLLMHRMSILNISTWHRLSRLRRSIPIKNIIGNSHAWLMRNAFPGRLFCDTKLSAKDLVHARSYNLTELCRQVMPGGSEKVTMRYIPPILDNLLKVESFSDNIEADFDSILDSIDLSKMFNSAIGIKELIDFCISEANLVLRLVHQLQALPLAFQITSICGNILSRTLAGGRSERNEWLLLHAFSSANYIVPDPPSYSSNKGKKPDDEINWTKTSEPTKGELRSEANATVPSGRRKPAYAGGLVLEPKVGFYDKFILLLDFNSLYPSIIQEFNICFTSINRSLLHEFTSDEESAMNKVNGLIEVLVHGSSVMLDMNQGKSEDLELPINKPLGMLPAEIKKLVDSRKAVKKLISSANANTKPSQLAQWDIRQKALKITANSVYGCLGFSASRFYAKPLAAIVTGLGRCLLMDTKERVENLNHEVIYGDTDSIMVNTNSRDLFSALFIGDKVRNEINKRYKLLELDTDGVYATILLLAKKKYAALSIVNPTKIPRPANGGIIPFEELPKKQELKGLDIVRRDWSPLAANVGRFVVSVLLSGQNEKDSLIEKIHGHLADIAMKTKENKLPLKDFTITKMLTKAPESYPDKKGQPHVSVALRVNANRLTNKLGAGDTVEYIICNDGTSNPATQRAYSPVEYMDSQKVKSEDGKVKLEIDTKYYLANQIHPVVCRLIAPIEETSASHIAEQLGLDPRQYGSTKYQDNEDVTNSVETLSLQKYNDCIPFVLFCPEESCKGKSPTSLRFPAFPTTPNAKTSWICQHCSRDLLRSEEDMIRCLHMVQVQMRICQTTYYQGVLRCSDSACRSLDRGSLNSLVIGSNKYYCLHCAMINGESQMRIIISEGWLFKQINFYKNLFVSSQYAQISHVKMKYIKLIEEVIDSEIESNPYATVDLGKIFTCLNQNQTVAA